MKRIIGTAMVLVIGLTLILTGCSGTDGGSGGSLPAPGRAAPDFQLKSLDGQTVSLADLKGSPVLLNFWATWCGPCRLEMPFIQRVHQSSAWEGEGLLVIGINMQESAALVEAFMDEYELTFPVLLDTNADTARRYNVSGIPATFFIDENGIIQKIKVGAYRNLTSLENDVMDLLWGDN